MNIGNNSQAQIKSVVERIEERERKRAEFADEIKDIYEEAKGNGLNVKALRAVIQRRKKDASELADHEARVNEYASALGALATTPLGRAAVERERARA